MRSYLPRAFATISGRLLSWSTTHKRWPQSLYKYIYNIYTGLFTEIGLKINTNGSEQFRHNTNLLKCKQVSFWFWKITLYMACTIVVSILFSLSKGNFLLICRLKTLYADLKHSLVCVRGTFPLLKIVEFWWNSSILCRYC